MSGILSDIFDLFARFGADRYGEELSIAQHMLQSAAMAESLGATPTAVTAALLHDIGYFVHSDGSSGYMQQNYWVYDRAGEPCLNPGCPGTIAREVQAGRSTFYCATCQI